MEKTNCKKYISDYDILMKEWNWEKNNELCFYPDKITYGSTKPVWWKCEKGHEWQAQPNSRTRNGNGRGCPYCANKKVLAGFNDLAFVYPNIAEEWNYEKNNGLLPTQIMYGSKKKVWWKCKKCGHEWFVDVDNRIHGTGCPACSKEKRIQSIIRTQTQERGSLQDNNPDILLEWDYERNEILPTEITSGSRKKVWWKCWKGHSWEDTIQHRTINGRSCPVCNGESKTSFQEQSILYYVSKHTKALNRESVFGKEIDIYLPSLNVGIEYNGTYWHANRKEKDLEKIMFFKKNGIRIISIEDGNEDCICGDNIFYKKDLEFAIKSLLNILNIHDSNIDISRDRIKIYEQYVQLEKDNSLMVKKPDLAKEWHPTKNGTLTPDMFSYSSNKVVWWLCSKCGREWEESINHRSSHDCKCIICSRKEFGEKNRGKNHYTSKPIVQCDNDNNMIKIWECAGQIERETGIYHSNIAACCIGKVKSAKGYKWYYLYDNKLKNGVIILGAISLNIVSDIDVDKYKQCNQAEDGDVNELSIVC